MIEPRHAIIPIDMIEEKGEFQPFPDLDQKTYTDFLKSITELGVINPIVVRKEKNGKYVVLDGHQRLRALREIGKTEVHCVVVDGCTDFQALQIAYISNIQRRNFTSEELGRYHEHLGELEKRVALEKTKNEAAELIRKVESLLASRSRVSLDEFKEETKKLYEELKAKLSRLAGEAEEEGEEEVVDIAYDMIEDMEKLREELARKEAEIRQKELEIRDREEKIARLEGDIQELRKELDKLREKQEYVAEEAYRAAEKQLRREINEKNESILNLTRELEKLKKEKRDLEIKYGGEYEDRIKALAARVELMEVSNNRVRNQITNQFRLDVIKKSMQLYDIDKFIETLKNLTQKTDNLISGIKTLGEDIHAAFAFAMKGQWVPGYKEKVEPYCKTLTSTLSNLEAEVLKGVRKMKEYVKEIPTAPVLDDETYRRIMEELKKADEVVIKLEKEIQRTLDEMHGRKKPESSRGSNEEKSERLEMQG